MRKVYFFLALGLFTATAQAGNYGHLNLLDRQATLSAFVQYSFDGVPEQQISPLYFGLSYDYKRPFGFNPAIPPPAFLELGYSGGEVSQFSVNGFNLLQQNYMLNQDEDGLPWNAIVGGTLVVALAAIGISSADDNDDDDPVNDTSVDPRNDAEDPPPALPDLETALQGLADALGIPLNDLLDQLGIDPNDLTGGALSGSDGLGTENPLASQGAGLGF